MSGTASASLAVGIGGGGELGYGGYRAPFTPVQWQELEHQAMIYKFLVAGLPVPPDLVMPIRRSFEALSTRFFQHPSLGYCSYYGKKFDPEPGRCRRTDGKKWRCSKDAHPDSKYCERHMHRGRNRSRKPVESQSISQSLSTAISHVSTGCSDNSGSFQHMPLYSCGSSQGSSFVSNVTNLETEPPSSYGIHNKEFSYINGLAPEGDKHSFSPEASRSLGLGSTAGNDTWQLMPSQKYDSHSLCHSSARLKSMDLLKQQQQQQHCFFQGNDTGSQGAVKQEQQPVHLFFGECPTTKEESWSNLDDHNDGNVFSSTQLSISIPNTAYVTSSEF